MSPLLDAEIVAGLNASFGEFMNLERMVLSKRMNAASARQSLPDRFDLALQRGASWALCMGLSVISL